MTMSVQSDLKYGAALMLLWLDEGGDFWVAFMREKKDKPKVFKEAGMIGVPCESYDAERGDKTVDDTFRALIDEELGRSHNEIPYIRGETPINGFRHHVPVYVGVALMDSRETFVPRDDDITFYGWLPIPAAACIHEWSETARIETKDILLEGFRLFEERGHELLGGADA